ncbi:hypothetical protein CDA63_00665 [Hymenobacter amundsenii]|uniref:Outer membrane protein beta-barrel domain-containing protein n=1 Tax=Hymenobacter amundsenii TaxID=2006685 RepID=A0A246FQ75_9BACT|nr:hypothetical protein [Hymenobacter amundsenii]OWP64903.1 hypothetical protein CDA63_00665 [Hymenobacter amundsenii]
MASAPNTPPNHQPPRPTGDLEHLFRQKFAEAEATPRANFWDQLDHELVADQHAQMVQQNIVYRQRAAVYRWAAAACLLLAFGFGSWAYLNRLGTAAGPELAAGGAAGQAGTGRSSAGLTLTDPAAIRLGRGTAGPTAAYEEVYGADAAYAATSASGRFSQAAGTAETLLAGLYQGGSRAAGASGQPEAAAFAYTASDLAAFFAGQGVSTGMGQPTLGADFGTLNIRSSMLRNGLGLGRPDRLKSVAVATPAIVQPAATTATEPKAAGRLWKRLHMGGSYAVGAFNPNINFSRTDARTQTDAVTTALQSYYQEDADKEYRRNLRSGLSQRVALTASYEMGRHWTAATGLEYAENRATSATTYGFLDGRQVGREAPAIFARSAAYAANSFAAPQAKTTSYRYRTAAVPVSVAYGSHKAGLSLYAKAGAVLSVLLSSRSELEGSPEAARTYDIRSSESPYRNLFASGRLGGGVRYQPVLSTWNLTVGPSAEVFVTTLNANPTRRAVNQNRPYNLGVEATIEFGSAKSMPGVQ